MTLLGREKVRQRIRVLETYHGLVASLTRRRLRSLKVHCKLFSFAARSGWSLPGDAQCALSSALPLHTALPRCPKIVCAFCHRKYLSSPIPFPPFPESDFL